MPRDQTIPRGRNDPTTLMATPGWEPAPSGARVDPLTGLADRTTFERVLAASPPNSGLDEVEDVIVALLLDESPAMNQRTGHDEREGRLLLVAETLCAHGDGPQFVARIDDTHFVLLIRTDQVKLRARVSSLVSQFSADGMAVRVGCVLRSRGTASDDVSAALAAAHRQTPEYDRMTKAREVSAPRVLAASRVAIAARIAQAEATGILMQWHRYSASQARAELLEQAQALAVPVTIMARLLVALAGAEATTDTVTDERGSHAQRTPVAAPPDAGLVINLDPARDVSTPPSTPGVDLQIAGRSQAAAGRRGSCGDWFDTFPLPDGTTAIVVGDVSGHNNDAAVIMLQLRTLTRHIAATGEQSPAEVLQRLDNAFLRLKLPMLATMLFGSLHVGRHGEGVLRWCSAGHLPPIVLNPAGATLSLACVDDLLLGLDAGSSRRTLSFAIPAGDTLLLFTDGLIETRRAHLDHGIARLRAAARPLAALPALALCDQLFTAMVPAHSVDDVTLLIIRLPQPAAAIPA